MPAGAIKDASGNANLAGATAATTTNTAKPEWQIDSVGPFGATRDIVVELSATDLGGGFRSVSGRPDPVVTNATVEVYDYRGGGVLYLRLRPTGGEVTLSITEGELIDTLTGNPTAAFGPEVIGTYDRTRPTVALSGLAAVVGLAPSQVTVTFSEAVSGFGLSDLTLVNLAASNLQTSDSITFTFDVVATADGTGSIRMGSEKAQDSSGNLNTVSNLVQTTTDATSPTIEITSSVSALAAGETAALTFTLSEDATDFDASDVAVTGGSLSGFAGAGSNYTATFTPTAGTTGNAVISVGDAAFTDAAGNANADAADANNTVTIAVDTGVPTIAINSSATAVAAGETAALTFTLSEDATDFDASDVAATGGSLSGFAGAGSNYTATFTPTAGTTGNAVISVGDAAFTDAAGNANADAAEANNTVTIAVDTGVPAVTLAGTPGFPGDPYPLTITFSEPVTGFTLADITGTGATISGFTNTCGSDPCASFTATVTADAGSEFSHSVSVAAGVAQDPAGNDNEASNVISPPLPDGVAPVLSITGVPDGFAGPQTVTVTFDFGEDVFGFEDADITVTGGTLGAISGGRQTLTAALTLVGTEPVTVSVAAGAVQDASGEPNVLTSVTGTQEMDPPSVSVIGTPGFPGDPYPLTITFSEPVTGFAAGDITGTGALISDFARSCATDPCASFSAVVNPSSGREFSHSVSVPAGVAQDLAGNLNLASPAFSPPPPDGTAPVLTITGVPNGFTGPETVTVTFDWGEDVLGFADADITVTGGTLGAITGGRQTWTAQLTVNGTTDVTIAVAGAAVQDATGTASVAASVTGAFASGAVAEELIREFIAARASSLVAAQPGLTGLLDNAAPSGNMQVTRGFGEIQFRSGSEGAVWAALDAQWSDIGGFETAYTHLTFGSHVYLQDETLLGVMVQFDHAASSEGVAEIEGTGWLIGPYYVARYGGVDIDARLLWGRTENEISPVGTYTDTFAGERVLAMVNLSGEIEAGTATLRPLVGWSYVDDRSEAYIDALANPVAAQRVRLSEFEAALDWTLPVGTSGTDFTGGIAGILTSEDGGNGSLDGGRGRVDFGLRRQGVGALDFDIGVYADGLFQPGLERYGVDLSVDWRF